MNHMRVVTENGRKMAILPLAEYKRLVAKIGAEDDAEDIRRFDATMARVKAGQESLIPSDVVEDIVLRGVSPIKAWRKYRKLTAEALAKKIGISRAYLTQIEQGSRQGTVDVLKSLAKALGTGLDALVE